MTRTVQDAWREDFDPRADLADQLDWPFVPVWQAAIVLGLSPASVYKACRSGDIPCAIIGQSYRIPTGRFVEFVRGPVTV